MPLAYRNADVSPAALRNIDSAETRRTVADASAASDEFLPFAAALRTELDPGSLLESVLAERVVLATWRLHEISRRDGRAARSGRALGPLTRAVLRAESSLETALTLLDRAR